MKEEDVRKGVSIKLFQRLVELDAVNADALAGVHIYFIELGSLRQTSRGFLSRQA